MRVVWMRLINVSFLLLSSSCLTWSYTARSLAENIQNTIAKPSISAGVGLIYKFDAIRLEVNFGLPIVASKSDATRKGIQIGIGLDFL